jgi:hypothetical protein
MISIDGKNYSLYLRGNNSLNVDVNVKYENNRRVENSNIVGIHSSVGEGYYLYRWLGVNSEIDIDRDNCGIVKIIGVDEI